ncbi:MAG: hypothetical protein NVSMB27_01700 [Ktedonobacteraceae bacterium]
MVLGKKHLGSRRGTREGGEEPAPQTRGRTITWAWLYDRVVGFLMLGREQAMRRMTVDLAQLQPGESVLDVGCGTGAVTMAAKGRVGETGRVYGIDAAPQMIAVARHKAAQHNIEIDFQVGLIERLAFPDDSFDVVLSSLMMHHLPDELKRQGLAEIARVLKPTGRLLVLDVKGRQTERNQHWAKRHGQHRDSHDLFALLLHIGKQERGIQDLPPMMKEAGFSQIETGGTEFRMLGFALGRITEGS